MILDVPGNKYIEKTFETSRKMVRVFGWLGFYENPLWYRVLSWSLSILLAGYIILSACFYQDEPPILNIYWGGIHAIPSFVHFTLDRFNSVEKIIKGSYFSFNYSSSCMKSIQFELLKNKKIRKLKFWFTILKLEVLLLNLQFGATTIIDTLLNGRHLEMYYVLLPNYIDSDALLTQIVTFTSQMIIANFAGFTITSFTGIILFLTIHMTTELELLIQGLKLLRMKANEISKNDRISFDEGYKIALHLSIQHHHCILNYFRRCLPALENAFTFAYGIGSTLLICIGFLYTMGRMFVKIEFTFETFSLMVCLYILTLCAQGILDKGDELRETVYGMDWVNLPENCRSSFKIFQTATHRSLAINLPTGGSVDLAAYLNIVKASYSYFNMIYVSTAGH